MSMKTHCTLFLHSEVLKSAKINAAKMPMKTHCTLFLHSELLKSAKIKCCENVHEDTLYIVLA